MATTIIERERDSSPAALLIFILFALIVLGGIWFAYTNGMFGKATVVENHTVLVPTPSTTPAPGPK